MTLSGTQGPPQRRKQDALGRRALAFALAVSLVLLSPGLAPYQAFASDFKSGGGPKTVPTLALPQPPGRPGSALPGTGLPAPAIPGLPASAIANPSLPAALPGAAGALPGIPAPAAAASKPGSSAAPAASAG